jgi:hypothetical protein
MLPGQVRLGRIFSIEIGLHFSWFIIAALLTMSLAGHLYSVNPTWPRGLMWTAAGLTALPLERLHRIDAGEPVTKALDTTVQEDVNQLPVLEGDRYAALSRVNKSCASSRHAAELRM